MNPLSDHSVALSPQCRDCGNAKEGRTQLCAWEMLPGLIAQTQMYLSTFCFPRSSACYEDTNLFGLIGGGDDAQELWGLGTPLFLLCFQEEQKQKWTLLLGEQGVCQLLNTSSVIFFCAWFHFALTGEEWDKPLALPICIKMLSSD